MTSKVTVFAVCEADEEVRVSITEKGDTYEEVLDNGESQDFYVYDNRVITIQEERK